MKPAGLKPAIHRNRPKEYRKGLIVPFPDFRLLNLDIELVGAGACDLGILQSRNVY